MKILLTNPKSASIFRTFGFVFPPTGLLCVAAYAEQRGCNVSIKDFAISGESPRDFSFKDYDIVGVTSDTTQFPISMSIAKEAKKAGCTVVMGGPHPLFVDKELLTNGSTDFVVHGEGELTFYDLVKTLESQGDLSKISGISFKYNGLVKKTPQRELIADLDTLPFPARHLIDMKLYNRAAYKFGYQRPMINIITSRGCPHDCLFCAVPAISGREWRSRSVDSIMAELDIVYNVYGYRAVAFCDDNFTISPERVKELCKRIIEKRYDLWWWCMSSPSMLIKNKEMLELMSKAGAKTVFIGVESGSETTLKAFNKKMDGNTAIKAVSVLKQNKIEIHASFILGGVEENANSILKTIKFARKLNSNVAQFSILTPYPGTALYKKLKNKIIDKKWHRFNGFFLVFRHEKVSYYAMELLLLWAYVSFYLRNWLALKGFVKVFTKNNPVMKKFFWKKRQDSC